MDGTARDVTNRYLDELFGKSDKNSAPKAKRQPRQPAAKVRCLSMRLKMCTTRARGYRPEEYRWGQGVQKSLIITSKAPGLIFRLH